MLLFASISISAFLSFVLLTKYNQSLPKRLLSVWLAFCAYYNLGIFLWTQDFQARFPDIIVSGFSIPLLIGPFMFLYVKYQITGSKFKKKDLFHFLPFLIVTFTYVDFFFKPFASRVFLVASYSEAYLFRNLLRMIAIYVSGPIYIVLCAVWLVRFRKKLKNEFSNTDKITFNWLLFLLAGIVVIWLTVLITGNNQLISKALAVFLILLGYFGLTQVNVFEKKEIIPATVPNNPDTNEIESETETEKVKYENSTVSETELSAIYSMLLSVMEKEKPYLNPELTLNELALLLNTQAHKLSQAINEKTGNTFYDLINERRVQAFIQAIQKEENKPYTILSIAYECGFNSKASFNRNFKKHTDMTPTQYLSQKRNDR